MKLSGFLSRMLAVGIAAAALLCAPACKNMFVAKHKVLVDAIAAPGGVKPTALSYRLLAKKSVVNNVPAQVSVIKACVDAALSNKGMFEAPANAPPDIFIEVAYGVDQTPKVDAAARETFLQLSARQNADKGIDRTSGPEIWDVRVAVLGIAGRIETAMPLLCAVASDYMGTDTKLETKVEIPQNAPEIGSVRETAIKALETKEKAARSASGAEDPAAGGTSAGAAAAAAVTPVK